MQHPKTVVATSSHISNILKIATTTSHIDRGTTLKQLLQQQ